MKSGAEWHGDVGGGVARRHRGAEWRGEVGGGVAR